VFDPYLYGVFFLLRIFAAPSLVQQIGPGLPETLFNHGTFRFAPEAREVLHDLWQESNAAHQERVACIRGYKLNGVFYITRAKRASFERADSLHLVPDLAACGSPEWDGTAHTHVSRFQGQPYVTFSNSDRMLMTWWRNRWRTEGAFCVLYSDSDAYCEYAADLNGDSRYSSNDPIEVMYYAGTPSQPEHP
jgi:hypothetical protein